MKKIICILACIGLCTSLFAGCKHEHKYSEATCTHPKTCECGATEGEALPHKWIDASCTKAKSCGACGQTEGNALGHLTDLGLCKRCNEVVNEDLVKKIMNMSEKYKFNYNVNDNFFTASDYLQSYINSGSSTYYSLAKSFYDDFCNELQRETNDVKAMINIANTIDSTNSAFIKYKKATEKYNTFLSSKRPPSMTSSSSDILATIQFGKDSIYYMQDYLDAQDAFLKEIKSYGEKVLGI